MKIAVVCANGKAGQLITKEAVNRGFDVTAFVRGENKSAAKKRSNQGFVRHHKGRFKRLRCCS